MDDEIDLDNLSVDMHEIFKGSIQGRLSDQVRFFEKFVVESADTQISSIEQQAVAAEKQGQRDREVMDDLGQEVAEVRWWVRQLAEAMLVSLYHFVERELKIILSWCPHETPDVWLTFDKLGVRLKKYGVDISKCSGYKDIDLLRRFCNSWKHNIFTASPQLLKALDIPRSNPPEHGHLDSAFLRGALFNRAGIAASAPDQELELIRWFCERARAFLLDLIDQAPLRKG